MWGIIAAVLGGAVALAALESATGERPVGDSSFGAVDVLRDVSLSSSCGLRSVIPSWSHADLLRGQSKTEAPKRVELLEKQEPRGEQTGSQAAEGSSANGKQQQRRAFTTAARGFAAGAARSAHLLPRAV